MKRLSNKIKNNLRQVRHKRVRKKVKGTAECPRLSVFRGLRSINLQLVDDIKGLTLCSANSKEVVGKKTEGERSGKVAAAYLTGKLLAEKAKIKKVNSIVFDRGGYKYHGRVKAVAEGLRDGELKF